MEVEAPAPQAEVGSRSGHSHSHSTGPGLIDRQLEKSIHIQFVRNILNVQEVINILENQVTGGSGDTDPEPIPLFDGAVIDMSLVLSPFLLKMAVYRFVK
jgi:hypothetical protein